MKYIHQYLIIILILCLSVSCQRSINLTKQMNKCVTSEIALDKSDSIDMVRDVLLKISFIRKTKDIGLNNNEIVVYSETIESNSIEYKFYTNEKTISVRNNKKKEIQDKQRDISSHLNQISNNYASRLYTRDCFVEDGKNEVYIFYLNGKITSIFASKGFSWNKKCEDKKLRMFYEFVGSFSKKPN